ncbi:MAG: chemotaxis protein CheW [Candidatus Bathyarchaeota archaeon]|nr:chemotaxis protein CheW [Candidatus Bathyarchaeota archaeon]
MTLMRNDHEDSLQIIVFYLDDKLYGVDINNVREITRVNEITPVPNAPHYVEGVTNLRGKVTTVINLRKKLGMPQKDVGDESRMILMESNGKLAGIIVDSVTEVTAIPRRDIEATPELVRASQEHTSYVRGVGKKDNKLIILMDLSEMLECEYLTEMGMHHNSESEQTPILF